MENFQKRAEESFDSAVQPFGILQHKKNPGHQYAAVLLTHNVTQLGKIVSYQYLNRMARADYFHAIRLKNRKFHSVEAHCTFEVDWTVITIPRTPSVDLG